MLHNMATWCERPRVFNGREAWLSGRGSLTELERHARELSSELYQGKMPKATYNALIEGTHSIYSQAKALGMDIKPEPVLHRK